MWRVGTKGEVQKGLSLLAAMFFSPRENLSQCFDPDRGALPFLNHLCFVGETQGVGGCFSAS